MSKQYTQRSLEERQQQMKEILQNLENGVKEVFTSENYIRYLETFSKFHNYSFNNTILILMQCPKASFVASYKDWTEKFNRIVKKGSKGIQILVPTPKKYWEEEECTRPDGSKYKRKIEKRKLYFKIGHVFDLSQTTGDELPTLTQNLEFDTPELNKLINCLFATSEVPISYDYDLKTDTDPNGYYSLVKKEICLKPELSALHRLKTIIHEYSHYYQETLFKEHTKDFDRDTKEVVAESCAYCVIEMLANETNIEKLSSEEYSFGYIASWGSKDLKELRSTLEMISKLSNLIFNWVSKQFAVA